MRCGEGGGVMEDIVLQFPYEACCLVELDQNTLSEDSWSSFSREVRCPSR